MRMDRRQKEQEKGRRACACNGDCVCRDEQQPRQAAAAAPRDADDASVNMASYWQRHFETNTTMDDTSCRVESGVDYLNARRRALRSLEVGNGRSMEEPPQQAQQQAQQTNAKAKSSSSNNKHQNGLESDLLAKASSHNPSVPFPCLRPSSSACTMPAKASGPRRRHSHTSSNNNHNRDATFAPQMAKSIRGSGSSPSLQQLQQMDRSSSSILEEEEYQEQSEEQEKEGARAQRPGGAYSVGQLPGAYSVGGLQEQESTYSHSSSSTTTTDTFTLPTTNQSSNHNRLPLYSNSHLSRDALDCPFRRMMQDATHHTSPPHNNNTNRMMGARIMDHLSGHLNGLHNNDHNNSSDNNTDSGVMAVAQAVTVDDFMDHEMELERQSLHQKQQQLAQQEAALREKETMLKAWEAELEQRQQAFANSHSNVQAAQVLVLPDDNFESEVDFNATASDGGLGALRRPRQPPAASRSWSWFNPKKAPGHGSFDTTSTASGAGGKRRRRRRNRSHERPESSSETSRQHNVAVAAIAATAAAHRRDNGSSSTMGNNSSSSSLRLSMPDGSDPNHASSSRSRSSKSKSPSPRPSQSQSLHSGQTHYGRSRPPQRVVTATNNNNNNSISNSMSIYGHASTGSLLSISSFNGEAASSSYGNDHDATDTDTCMVETADTCMLETAEVTVVATNDVDGGNDNDETHRTVATVNGSGVVASMVTPPMSASPPASLVERELGPGPMRFAPNPNDDQYLTLEEQLCILTTHDRRVLRNVRQRWTDRKDKSLAKYGFNSNKTMPDLPMEWHLRFCYCYSKKSKQFNVDGSHHSIGRFSEGRTWAAEKKLEKRFLLLNAFDLAPQLQSKVRVFCGMMTSSEANPSTDYN